MQKLTLKLLGGTLILSSLVTQAFAANLTFTDVPTDSWYYEDVEYAVNNGLVNGKSATVYAPESQLTAAEAVKLASAMHELSETGEVTLEIGSPWYMPYVEYAKAEGIITKDYNWNTSITRGEYMDMFARALPSTDFEAVNEIDDGVIPDVPMTHEFADEIYMLYRSGVLTGSGSTRSAKPDDTIRRSEVAAILTRMMNETSRQKYSLVLENEETLKVTVQPVSQSNLTNSSQVELKTAVTGGTAPYTYDWQVDFSGWHSFKNDADRIPTSDVSGFTTDTLDVRFSSTFDGMDFRCVITDADGNKVTTTSATLSMKVPETQPLKITTQPVSQEYILDGEQISFEVVVTGGTAPYTYDWQVDFSGWHSFKNDADRIPTSDVSGYTTDTLGVRASSTFDGLYFRCVITDADGNKVTSDTARIVLY